VESEPLVRLEYAAVVDSATLTPVERIQGEVLIPLAARVGGTRLIDNVIVKLEG
jgi:pantoate--beta-alanine ligase